MTTPQPILLRLLVQSLCPTLSGFIVLCGFGCAARPTELTISSPQRGDRVTSAFTTAYSVQNAAGDTDVVLLDDAQKQALAGAPANPPIRQIIHIRVLWKPMRDLKADHTSASNAILHWYVIGTRPSDILEYDGTAMVVVASEENGAKLSIRSASIHPVARRGALRDPIGPAILHGTVQTTDNPRGVVRTLNAVRSAVAAANAAPGNLTLGAAPEPSASSAQ